MIIVLIFLFQDKFTISGLTLNSIGENFKNCGPDIVPKVTYYPTATKKSNHRAVLESDFMLIDIDAGLYVKIYLTYHTCFSEH